MPITNAFTNAAKLSFMKGEILPTDTFKIALYTSSASLDATTTSYSSTNEVSGTGYTAGGATLASLSQALSSGVAVMDFADPSWTTATITARGAVIYDDTHASDRVIAVLDFGSDKTSTAGTFTVVFPTPDNVSGLIRIA